MKDNSNKFGWEKAIIKVLESKNGIATLKDFYKEVPILIQETKAKNFEHNIRGYLTRLKTQKKLIKQIGLSSYSLIDVKVENNLFEEVKKDEFETEFLNDFPKENIHNYMEGFLIELGNFKGYQTYTPDKNVIFNGKKLSEITDYQILPDFTYKEIIESVKQIDVLWILEGFPYRTFDIEHSTDFTKAFLRAYQLRYFKTKFILVADHEKKNIFEKRVKMQPFCNCKESFLFNSYKDIFELYKNTVLNYELSSASGIF